MPLGGYRTSKTAQAITSIEEVIADIASLSADIRSKVSVSLTSCTSITRRLNPAPKEFPASAARKISDPDRIIAGIEALGNDIRILSFAIKAKGPDFMKQSCAFRKVVSEVAVKLKRALKPSTARLLVEYLVITRRCSNATRSKRVKLFRELPSILKTSETWTLSPRSLTMCFEHKAIDEDAIKGIYDRIASEARMEHRIMSNIQDEWLVRKRNSITAILATLGDDDDDITGVLSHEPGTEPLFCGDCKACQLGRIFSDIEMISALKIRALSREKPNLKATRLLNVILDGLASAKLEFQRFKTGARDRAYFEAMNESAVRILNLEAKKSRTIKRQDSDDEKSLGRLDDLEQQFETVANLADYEDLSLRVVRVVDKKE